jgi:hypothetical protein
MRTLLYKQYKQIFNKNIYFVKIILRIYNALNFQAFMKLI